MSGIEQQPLLPCQESGSRATLTSRSRQERYPVAGERQPPTAALSGVGLRGAPNEPFQARTLPRRPVLLCSGADWLAERAGLEPTGCGGIVHRERDQTR